MATLEIEEMAEQQHNHKHYDVSNVNVKSFRMTWRDVFDLQIKFAIIGLIILGGLSIAAVPFISIFYGMIMQATG